MSFDTEITGRLLTLARYHFDTPGRIQDSNLQSYTWSSANTTNIKIEAGGRDDHANTSMTPAVYMYAEDTSNNTLNSLADYTITVNEDDMVSDSYLDLEKGATAILCEGRTRAQSGALADELYTYIRKVSPVLKDDFDLFYITVNKVASKQPVNQKSFTTYISNILVSWARFHSWMLSYESV